MASLSALAPASGAMPASLRQLQVDHAADAEGLPGWELRFLQMTPGAFEGRSTCLELPGMQVLRETFGGVVVNEYGAMPAGSLSIGVPRVMRGEARFNGGAWRGGICFTRSEQDFNTVLPPADMLAAVVSLDALVPYVRETEQLDISHWLKNRPHISDDAVVTQQVGAALQDLLDSCLQGEVRFSDAAVAQALQGRVLEILGPLIASQMDAPAPAFREVTRTLIVKAARRYATDHIDQPIKILDVCRALNVSRRTLQDSFQDVLGVAPLAYLRTLRLNGARCDLLQPAGDTQVRDVVSRWGFWHLSRFSAEYRAMFGELPSTTLRRSLGRPPLRPDLSRDMPPAVH